MVNSTIPSVVIQNFTLRSGMVTCHITVGRKIFVLGGTNIKVLCEYWPCGCAEQWRLSLAVS
uniref:Uncharacterized protein n=1 Tax=Anguilla anguilla TaxID=7936 RepID=A0A0E9XKN8_ANGAN